MRPAPGNVRRKLPTTQSPQLCQIAEAPPEGGDWLSEIKFDGYRLLGFLDEGAVRLLTRNEHDWSNSGSARSAAPRVAAACTSPCRCRRAPTGTRRARSAVRSLRP
jgi:bifunctional non-homologous end joining protein LigD